jgi:hypothetical protein
VRQVIYLSVILSVITLVALHFKSPPYQKVVVYNNSPVTLLPGEQLTKFTATYVSTSGEESPTDIQCPIPISDRVPNRTGVQCVWASIEMIGRWAEEPKLMNPPLTSRRECKSYSSPSLAASVLHSLNIKFEQSFGNPEDGIRLIKKAMTEHRGCLWGVPGHAMVIVHFDEEKNIFKWVDNSDRTLKVQTSNMKYFERMWDTWVLVIYADHDIISDKIEPENLADKIEIRDRNNAQGIYPKGYIIKPDRRLVIPQR